MAKVKGCPDFIGAAASNAGTGLKLKVSDVQVDYRFGAGMFPGMSAPPTPAKCGNRIAVEEIWMVCRETLSAITAARAIPIGSIAVCSADCVHRAAKVPGAGVDETFLSAKVTMLEVYAAGYGAGEPYTAVTVAQVLQSTAPKLEWRTHTGLACNRRHIILLRGGPSADC